MRPGTGFAAVLLGASFALQPALAADDDAAVDRLTDSAVELLPMGRIFEMVAAKDPTWPARKAGSVTASQLACLRSELSSDGYRRTKRAEIAQYALSHRSRLAGDAKLLEQVAPLFGELVMAGAAGEGAKSPEEILRTASGEQMLALVTLVGDPATAELRKAVGLGDALNLIKSEAENEASGEQLGASLAAQTIIKATITCKVPPGAFL